jgi:hypothetical protein
VSAAEDLAELLREAGVKAYFDCGNSINNPCTFCGKHPPWGSAATDAERKGWSLVVLGRYFDGTPLSRPVCVDCKGIAEKRARKQTGNDADR